MIDIHSHILPGIDDGPESLEESVEMARIYVAAGYHTVVATPHYIPGTSWTPEKEGIQARAIELNAALVSREIRLKVLTGMEIAMDPSIPDLLAQDRLLTLAESTYLLLETPFQRLPYGWNQVVFDLVGRGYGVLLAHPERCAQLVEKPAGFEELIEAGCAIQVNWGSLLGQHGGREAQLAKYLAGKGFIHCLATDSHDATDRNAGFVQKALGVLRKIVGEQGVNVVMQENPVRILKSEVPAIVKCQQPVRKMGGLRRLFHGNRC